MRRMVTGDIEKMSAEVVCKSCLYTGQDKGEISHAQHKAMDELKTSVNGEAPAAVLNLYAHSLSTRRRTHSKLAAYFHSCLCIHVTQARVTRSVSNQLARDRKQALPPSLRIGEFSHWYWLVLLFMHTDRVDV